MTGSAVAGGSFFHLAGVDITDQPCQGTACFVARHRAPERWAAAEATDPRVYCLGMCHLAPAAASDEGRPSTHVDAAEPVVLGRVVAGGAPTFGAARATGAYGALEQALGMAPDGIIHEVESSRLRGRGGAGFPTGDKWRAVRAADAGSAFVVANADEGDPGAFLDRVLLEEDPHAVIEGLAIAALAVGANVGYVYVRKEYSRARVRLERARQEAHQAGVLGRRLLGSGAAFDIEVVEGEGSYVCGEETALLNALEGRRPEVRPRPPYPAQRGLFGRPTLVNNVETLATIPWIVSRGGAAYAAMGTPGSSGTKVLSLNSLFRRPGLYEVEMGLPVRDVIERLGGGLADGALRGVLIGGPLAGVLPPDLLDTPLDFTKLRAVGCDVGHGGVVAFDEHTSIPELAHHVFRFGAYESCGKCTPCRLGTWRIEQMLRSTIAGERPPAAAGEWRDIVSALAATSLCGHGSGLAAFASSLVAHFGAEIDRCLT
jgi:NADH:ubiquinone oxidoreductase subunit F (NADH-binding)